MLGVLQGGRSPSLLLVAGCQGPLSSQRRKRVMASSRGSELPIKEPPGVNRLSPALSHPPGERCGKGWIFSSNKLYSGLLCFNQSLIRQGVLSCCSDPVPLLDLRAGVSPPSRFPFPPHSRLCHFPCNDLSRQSRGCTSPH